MKTKETQPSIKDHSVLNFISSIYKKWSEQKQANRLMRMDMKIANEKLNVRLKKQINDLKVQQLATNNFNSTQLTHIIITSIICATVLISLYTFFSFKKLELNHKLIMIEKMK